jgi:hypothetical protein
MPKKRNEAILIRNHGGKLVEVHIVPHSQKQGNARFQSDNVVVGAMETRALPERFDALIEWLDRSGRLGEVEQMVKAIFE